MAAGRSGLGPASSFRCRGPEASEADGGERGGDGGPPDQGRGIEVRGGDLGCVVERERSIAQSGNCGFEEAEKEAAGERQR